MAVVTVELVATMADGKQVQVVADQRDFAKWEIQPYDAQSSFTRMRFLAWSAAYRGGAYKGSFAEFNELDCVEVNAPADAEEAEGLDPGRAAAAATA